jgi:UDP-N-acetylmuramate dehydrogenase
MVLAGISAFCILKSVGETMSKRLDERRIDWVRSEGFDEYLDRWSRQVSATSRIVRDEPLSRRSSLRVGGPARRWIEVGELDDLWRLLAGLRDDPFFCVGLGSNTLFPDQGIEEPVIRLVDEMAGWTIEAVDDGRRARVSVRAGAINAHLVRGLLREGWVGAEFLSLIPGTFGGAVALNAGTKEKELAAILEDVWLAIPDEENACWKVEKKRPEQIDLRYRHAELPDGALVVGGTVLVERGDVKSAKELVRADKERRNRTQPYRLASVGSTFANPEGDYAGRLIEEVGLKGTKIGGAMISELHANFFINADDATAEDFLSLMALARHRVKQKFGVSLRPEVRFVGFDGRARMRDLEQELEDKDV